MATSAEIGIINKSGTVTAVYNHGDGYVDGVGEILTKYYTDPAKVKELIDLGRYGISYLGPEIGEEHKWHNPPDDSYTGFYGRDRKQFHIMSHTYDSVDDFINGYQGNYGYLFNPETKRWMALKDRKQIDIPGAKKYTDDKYLQFFEEGKIKLTKEQKEKVKQFVKKLIESRNKK